MWIKGCLESSWASMLVKGSPTQEFKCHKGLNLPFTYFGLPIGENPRRKEMLQPVIQNFSKKLSIWKHNHISFVGRICLINYVLSSLCFFTSPNSIFSRKL